jgi:cytochrome c oxidase subunit 3
MAAVASVSAVDSPPGPSVHATLNRPDMVQVGTIVWLASELMFFAGLFAMYFTIRSVAPDLWQSEPLKLNIPFSLANTINLVLSSVWCQMGVFAAERYQPSALGSWWKPWTREHGFRNWGMREWYLLTYAAGALFIAGQIFEYAELFSENLTISSSGYGSVFFLTTGFHGMHVTGGLIAFLLIIGRSFAVKNFGHKEAVSAIVTSYYWHFVDVVWIGLFATIYLLK